MIDKNTLKIKNAIGVVEACGLNINGSKDLMEEVARIEKTIIAALKKQLPQKPNKHSFDPSKSISSVSYTCPICSKHIGRDACCKHCGQALDWGDTNDR